MVCPKCNMTLHDGEKFCPNCGAEIDVSLYEEEKRLNQQNTDIIDYDERTGVYQRGSDEETRGYNQGAAPYRENINGRTGTYDPSDYQDDRGYTRTRNPEPPKKNKTPVVLVVILSIVVLILLGVVVYLFACGSCNGSKNPNGATTASTQPSTAASTAKQTDPPTLMPDTEKPTTAPTEKPTEAPTEPEPTTPSSDYDGGNWVVTLPGYYVDHCKVVEEEDGTMFYAKSTYEDASQFDGLLFRIVESDTEDMPSQKARKLGSKQTEDGEFIYFFAVYPADTRYNTEDAAKAQEYTKLEADRETVIGSFSIK